MELEIGQNQLDDILLTHNIGNMPHVTNPCWKSNSLGSYLGAKKSKRSSKLSKKLIHTI